MWCAFLGIASDWLNVMRAKTWQRMISIGKNAEKRTGVFSGGLLKHSAFDRPLSRHRLKVLRVEPIRHPAGQRIIRPGVEQSAWCPPSSWAA